MWANLVMKVSLFDLFSPAFSTRSRILLTVDSPKDFSIIIFITPDRLTQPEHILSPTPALLGMLSPVRAMVLRLVSPSVILPSRGIFSPGRTMIVSPTATFPGSTTCVLPFLTTFAVSGRISIRCEMDLRLLSSA